MVRKERLELSMGSFMQRLATNDLVFMDVLRLGVTNVGCQRLLKVADFCPKAVHKSIVIYKRVFVYFKACKAFDLDYRNDKWKVQIRIIG